MGVKYFIWKEVFSPWGREETRKLSTGLESEEKLSTEENQWGGWDGRSHGEETEWLNPAWRPMEPLGPVYLAL